MIVIYELTCTQTQKSYIGKNNSEKSEEHYSHGRFWDESENEELVNDDRYGAKAFEVKILLETEVLENFVMNEFMDALILKRQTLAPNVYNRQTFTKTDPRLLMAQ